MAEEIKPQIQSTEIADWENRFKQNVSPLVQFNKDGDNSSSFKLYKGSSGLEVEWSGTINLGSDDYIKWKFSILNDVFIDSKFKLNEDTKDLIRKIYDLYVTWQKEWSQNLSQSGKEQQQLKESRTKENIIKYNKERMTSLAGLR